jgi:phenylacetate-CoA ligase
MAMPLIRYETGDLVQLGNAACRCGRVFPVVRKIVGRQSNILVTPSGRMLGPSAIEAMMENVLFDMKGMPVLYGQMIQESYDVMTLEYVPLSGFSREHAEKLRSIAAKHVPADFNVNIRQVKNINKTPGGKVVSLAIQKHR